MPFEIPENWEWIRVRYITELFNGRAFKPSDWTTSGLPIVRIQNLNDPNAPYNHYSGPVEAAYLLHGGELLFAWSGTPGTSFGAHIWHGGEAVLNQHIFRLEYPEAIIDKRYYMYALNQRVLTLIGAAHGSAGLQHVTKGVFESTLIPLPPYQEQLRIVERLNEIQPLVDSYDSVQKAADQLNTSFPDQLRKSILQLAVQGKLVPQDPTDEPASVLLERIRAEKERLIAAGRIKRDKHESIIFRRDNSHYEKLGCVERCIDDEVPFEIPDSWRWIRLHSVITLISGQDYDVALFNDNGEGVPYITGASNIDNGQIVLNRWTTCPRCIATEGDLLIVCKGAGVGKMAILQQHEVHIARQIMGIQAYGIEMKYLQLFLEYSLSLIRSRMQGVIPGISRDDILSLLFPLPPFDEQQRIVKQKNSVFERLMDLQR